MKSLVCLLVLALSWLNIEASPTTPTPASDGIPPCLIPPFRNLVYNYETLIEDRPKIRTGCYIQADSNGSPYPLYTVFPVSTAKPLQYYVVDDTGEKKFLPENGTVNLQFQDDKGNISEIGEIFKFNQICFPILCYSTFERYARSCYNPFATCGKCGSTSSDERREKIKHVGKAVSDKNTWLYCMKDQQLVPIQTPKYPFGDLNKLTRLPGFSNATGPRILLRVRRAGRPGTITTGCDVIFPLGESLSNTYQHRFWYKSEDGSGVDKYTTITEGQTGTVRRHVPKFICKDYVPVLGERACTEGSWVETVRFEDICFPEECFTDQEYKCNEINGGLEKRLMTDHSVTFLAEQTVLHSKILNQNFGFLPVT